MIDEQRRDDILKAAERVFVRFGYRRTTMGDIAEEAGISRPALYPVFSSKEEVFSAVLDRVLGAALEQIRTGISKLRTPKEKLRLALEIWAVKNYEVTHSSPGATDLYECSLEFASEVAGKTAQDFDAILSDVLDPLVRKHARVKLTAAELARLISGSIIGLKSIAKDAAELRDSTHALIDVVLASVST